MLKNYVTNFGTPQLEYAKLRGRRKTPQAISVPGLAHFLIEGPRDIPVSLKAGDKIVTGQKLALESESSAYAVSTVTGTVKTIEPFIGNYGRRYMQITIATDASETFDDQFAGGADTPSLEHARTYLATLPGAPDFASLSDPERPIDTLVISGVDQDIFIQTAQHVVETRMDAIKKGIQILKAISGVERILMVLPQDTIQGIGEIGATPKGVSPFYPSGLPHRILHAVLNRVVPAGQSWQDMGVQFFSVEAVAALGEAYDRRRIPVDKIITLMDKDGTNHLVSARIGTPLCDIPAAFGITLNDNDRIILGGPMTGVALYSVDYPVQPDTDAVMIQDSADLPYVSDNPCINCGQCVRICPARIPVNMLIRFLEAGQYEEAADAYDLYSCIECGLCSFVCVSKLPVFQYIRLAKYELSRTRSVEAANDEKDE